MKESMATRKMSLRALKSVIKNLSFHLIFSCFCFCSFHFSCLTPYRFFFSSFENGVLCHAPVSQTDESTEGKLQKNWEISRVLLFLQWDLKKQHEWKHKLQCEEIFWKSIHNWAVKMRQQKVEAACTSSFLWSF